MDSLFTSDYDVAEWCERGDEIELWVCSACGTFCSDHAVACCDATLQDKWFCKAKLLKDEES